MKKILSMVLALSLVLSLAACGGKNADTTTAATENNSAPTENITEAPTDTTEGGETGATVDTDSLEGIINAIYETNPVEFMPASIGIDLTDTSEEGLWTLSAFTGLENADMISEAWASEAMVGSIPYSLVMVRVTDAANAQTVAEAMKNGIDQRKWICVEADDLMVTGSGDVVMLIMVGSDTGLTAQSFVDAFSTVMGGTDFVQ